MDAQWTIEDWKPTVPAGSSWQPPKMHDVIVAMDELAHFTAEIYRRPHSPSLWYERSMTLIRLGYPELAAGDAYKAKLLCDAFIEGQDADLVKKVRDCMGMSLSPLERFARLLRVSLEKVAQAESRNMKIIASMKPRIYEKLVMALEYCLCFGEAMQYCRQGLKETGDSSLNEMLQNLEARPSNKEDAGSFVVERYPWMIENHATRSMMIFDQAIDHVGTASDGRCTLKRSTLDGEKSKSKSKKTVRFVSPPPTEAGTGTDDIHASPSKSMAPQNVSSLSKGSTSTEWDDLGVFAEEKIKVNTKIMTDITAMGAANSEAKNECENCYKPAGSSVWLAACCSALYCSPLCRDLAANSYHQATCGKVFPTDTTVTMCTELYNPFGLIQDVIQRDMGSANRLILRLLCCSIGQKCHPLDCKATAGLQGQYGSGMEMPFALDKLIVTPLQNLRQLGVDIFAYAQFDTWVLLTLWHRIYVYARQSSRITSGTLVSINPCFCFINHSCNPNVEWKYDENSTAVAVYAKKVIEKGEEIFVSYLGLSELGMDKAQRQAILKPLLGGRTCRCEMCEAT